MKMEKLAYFWVISLLILVVNGDSRQSGTFESVSDGVNKVERSTTSLIQSFVSSSSSSDECEPLYGFLPCSTNLLGYLFLIVVYEYLLFHGESYVASGGERIFQMLGPGVFGASAFHVIGALPEALIVLASALMNTKEKAEEHVYTVVGLLAGTTILHLTLVWGTCVIVASQKLSNDSNSRSLNDLNTRRRLLSSLNGYGVKTDMETSYMARIMVVSVAPFIIIQIPKIFNYSNTSNMDIFILISLIVSLLLLSVYFFFQIFKPWIQERRWELMNNKNIISEILQNVRNHALQKILNDDGSPNVKAIKGLFEEIDEDEDNNLSQSEVKELIVEINKFKRLFSNENRTMEEVMKNFDINGDSKLNMDEFVFVITKWLDQTKGSQDKPFEDLHEVLGPWIINRKKERQIRSELITKILRYLQKSTIGSLRREDGTPNVPRIKRLFETLDRDKNNCISMPELKEVIVDIKFGNLPIDADAAAAKIMEELDTSGDNMVSEDEFVIGVSKWLHPDPTYQPLPQTTLSRETTYQENLEEAEELVEIEKIQGRRGKSNEGMMVWMKAILLLISGIGILSFLAEPLINSVQQFSKAARIPTFFIGFILVPLATNARGAISAITEASRKKSRITSLTFSEIYSGVLMNNFMNFSVLIAIIYIRGLEWDYSSEVLVVLIVSAALGLVTSFRSTYPIWTSAMAIFLYPLSLLMVYILQDVLNYS